MRASFCPVAARTGIGIGHRDVETTPFRTHVDFLPAIRVGGLDFLWLRRWFRSRISSRRCHGRRLRSLVAAAAGDKEGQGQAQGGQ